MRHKWDHRIQSGRCLKCGMKYHFKMEKNSRAICGEKRIAIYTAADGKITESHDDKVPPCTGEK